MNVESGLVSVIIPVYNGARYLGAAIESVLSQTYQPTEIIVVDDGSSDGSAGVARQFESVTCIVQPNQGSGAARNRGIALSRGEYLAFLDADDVWEPQKTAIQIDALRKAPDAAIVFCGVQQFVSPELSGTDTTARVARAAAAVRGCIPSAMIVRRPVFESPDMLFPETSIAEFADWYLRFVDRGFRSVTLPQVLARRRIHDTNSGIRMKHLQKNYLRSLKASLDRRRERTLSRESIAS